MPKLKDINSGAVVSVSDDTAARLGAEWVPVEAMSTEPVKHGRPKKSEQ